MLDAPKGQHGRTVTLDVAMDKSRIEDIMTMAVKAASPPMVGGLKLNTKFLLPPGENDVVDRLRLDGQFWIAQGAVHQLRRAGQDRGAEQARARQDG